MVTKGWPRVFVGVILLSASRRSIRFSRSINSRLSAFSANMSVPSKCEDRLTCKDTQFTLRPKNQNSVNVDTHRPASYRPGSWRCTSWPPWTWLPSPSHALLESGKETNHVLNIWMRIKTSSSIQLEAQCISCKYWLIIRFTLSLQSG